MFLWLFLVVSPVACRVKRVVHGFAQPVEAARSLVLVEASYGKAGEAVRCGGTILSPSVILTAGHCVLDGVLASSVKVSYDTYNVSQAKSMLTTQIQMHPTYNSVKGNSAYDLALIFLPEKIELCTSPYSPQVARMPSHLHQYPLRNTTCFILGWGKTEAEQYAVIPLHAVIVDVHEVCESNGACFLRGRGDGEMRACFGDSGGPFVCSIKDQLYLLGVNSAIAGGTVAPQFPLDSYRQCDYNKQLFVSDVRNELATITRLLMKFGYYQEFREAQEFCYDNMRSTSTP